MSSENFLLEDLAAPVKNAIVGGPFGSNLVSKDYVESGIPVIRGQNMGEKWVSGSFVFVSPEKAGQLEQNKARPGDVVFTQRGTLGQVSIVPASPYAEYVVSQSQMKITLDPNKADAGFIYYLFKSEHQLRYILNSAIQTGVPHTNLGILRKTPVTVPSLKAQKSIAGVLCALDDRITLLRETNATLQAIAQALFKSWFVDFDPVRAKAEGLEPEGMDAATGALFPDSFEESELGLVPRGWFVKPIGDAVECIGGGTPNTKDPSYWEPAEHAWTTPKDLSGLQSPVLLNTERKLSTLGLAKVSSGLLPAGTLLLSSRAPIGYLAIAQMPIAVNQGYIAIPSGGDLSPLYMLFWCRQNMEGIKARANGSTFMEISKKAFRPIPALVPSANVLAAFANVAEPLFERLIKNERQAQILTQLRDTLLPRLISGQLRLLETEACIENMLSEAV
jgi:type I restriction enzyme S subunit